MRRGGLEAATILEDVFPAIPFGKTEIKNFFSIQRADAAGAGAEAVDEPGDSGERGHLQDSNATEFASIQSELDRVEETVKNVCPAEGRLRALRLGVSVFAGATTLTV